MFAEPVEAGRLMSETLPPKINLREGREKKEGETGEEGREEEEGKQPFNGDRRGKSLRFNGIKTAQFLQGARAASGNVGVFREPGSIFLLLSDGSSDSGTIRAVI